MSDRSEHGLDSSIHPASAQYCFGPFRFEPTLGRLYRYQHRIRLQRQPTQVLQLLLEHPGELVTREEIQQRLWPPDTHVDFENGLNSVLNRIRQALGDSAEAPRYIETLARMGYRFIAPVGRERATAPVPAAGDATGDGNSSQEPENPFINTCPRAQTCPLWQANVGGVDTQEPAKIAASRRWMADWPSWPWPAGILLVLLVSGGAFWHYRAARPYWPQLQSYRQLTNDAQAKPFTYHFQPLLSSNSLVYFTEYTSTGLKPVMVPLQGGATQRLHLPLKNVSFQDISKDGRQILLIDATTSQLWKLSLPERSLSQLPDIHANAACWSPHLRRIAFARDRQLYLARADGSHARPLASFTKSIAWLRWSPDGRQLRFTMGRPGYPHTIWELRLAHPRHPQPLWTSRQLHNPCCGSWTADGSEYFFYSRESIWVLPRGATTPRPLMHGPLDFYEPTAIAHRRLLVLGERPMRQLMRYDATLRMFVPYLGGIQAIWVTTSPDRRWIAYIDSNTNLVWLAHPDGSGAQQITFAPLESEGLAWSPDSRQLLIRAQVNQHPWRIYLYSLLTKSMRRLGNTGINIGIPSWSPSGRRITYGDLPNRAGVFPLRANLHIYTLASHRRVDVPHSRGLWTARWSRTGRWLAALTQTNQRLELYSFRTRRWRQTHITHVDNPIWSRHGHYLYFDTLGRDRAIFRYDPAFNDLERLANLNHWGHLYDGWCGLTRKNVPLVLSHGGIDEIYVLRWN